MFELNWPSFKKGHYNVYRGQIELDFSKNFSGGTNVFLSVIGHEQTHLLLMLFTEFGLACTTLTPQIENINILNKGEKEKIIELLTKSQDFVQEGLATFKQANIRWELESKSIALEWLENAFEKDSSYITYISRLKLAFGLSKKFRDIFIDRAMRISMNTSIVKDALQLNLFTNVDRLRLYLDDTQNNPNKRLERFLRILFKSGKINLHLLQLSIEDIAQECGLIYFPSSTQKEIAEFVQYTLELSKYPIPFPYKNLMWPAPTNLIEEAISLKNIAIGNLDIMLNDSTLVSEEDFLKRAAEEDFESIFCFETSKTFTGKQLEDLREIFGYDDRERILIGISPLLGHKFYTLMSDEAAEALLDSTLQGKTYIVRNFNYDLFQMKAIFSRSKRLPDIVIYNKLGAIENEVLTYLRQNPNTSVKYITLRHQYNENLITLLIELNSSGTILLVGAIKSPELFGMLKILNRYGTIMTKNEFSLFKNKVFHAMYAWMNVTIGFDGL